MSVDPGGREIGRTFLEVARILLRQTASPAIHRSIVNRAYYAAFRYVRAHPCADGFRADKSRSEHRALIRHLGDSPTPTYRHVADHLNQLFSSRLDADYGDQGSWIGRADAIDCIEMAAEIIEGVLVVED